MSSLHPDELPADVECSKCGKTVTIPSSWRELYGEDGYIRDDAELTTKTPTSKRVSDIYFHECGRRVADILNPHWPGGASGGYVESP